MKNKPAKMRAEYPAALIRAGERGKFTKEMRAGSHQVVIEPDLHELFPDSASVNKALRAYLRQTKSSSP